ncbi:DUF4422 domain-containing protein [Candidatus Pelagibacter sp.]|nr:DUF4422 domain-containing protein [Candidatus Pelagibacter sp.]
MEKVKFYCVTNKKVNFLNKKNYYLSWVGKDAPPLDYLRCDKNNNIFYKEQYYSELTFHYWYWKNLLKLENEDQWIGFCQKRRYWIKIKNKKLISEKNINDYLITEPLDNWKNFDAIICKSINVSGAKKIKILKRGLRNILKKPSAFFIKENQNLAFHFDMHHGFGNLDKAINQLDNKNKHEFKNFVESNITFNPHIMFISKPKVLNEWFSNLFPWLERCEKVYDFNKLKGYDTRRLLAYLSERYLSYWFNRYYKCKEENWVQLNNF